MLRSAIVCCTICSARSAPGSRCRRCVPSAKKSASGSPRSRPGAGGNRSWCWPSKGPTCRRDRIRPRSGGRVARGCGHAEDAEAFLARLTDTRLSDCAIHEVVNQFGGSLDCARRGSESRDHPGTHRTPAGRSQLASDRGAGPGREHDPHASGHGPWGATRTAPSAGASGSLEGGVSRSQGLPPVSATKVG